MPSMIPIPYRGWKILPRQMMTGRWIVYWYLTDKAENFIADFQSEQAAVQAGKDCVDTKIQGSS
jgi:hypothetical protein